MRLGDDDVLVAAQGAALAAVVAWPGRALWRLPAAVRAACATAGLLGAALAVAGGAEHGGRLTPHVAPPEDAVLLEDGPYRWSRHPIYGGLALATLGLAVARRRPEPLAAWAVLVAVLTAKTAREERHLARRFAGSWERYRDRTPRLVGLPRA